MTQSLTAKRWTIMIPFQALTEIFFCTATFRLSPAFFEIRRCEVSARGYSG
jgi:hypothetical protein